MRVFLDTNIWSYIADHQAADDLASTARASGVDVIVSPAIVDEVRQIPDAVARRRVLRVVTRSDWKRLMPEIYSECMELKAEICRLRPEWVILNPKMGEVNRLRYDWVRRLGGFWDRAHRGLEPETTDESVRGEREAQLAKNESYAIRKRVATVKKPMGNTHLQLVAGMPSEHTPGWDGEHVDYWRTPSLNFFRLELEVYASPVREWLDNEIDVWAMLSSRASMNQLWLHELDAASVPRQWLRGAFEFLQAWHKVTDGTPGDSRLATHLVEADRIISADKNFVRFSERCRAEAPFKTGQAIAVPAGREWLKQSS
ncbi:hypothetical protein [Paraburkholderia metrosideri]|nr:hypothetical protein [Paraburkholderia metrosideri]